MLAPKVSTSIWVSLQLFYFELRNNTGAPNENIDQNHLKIALLNVVSIWTVEIGILLSPKKFSSVRIS